MLSFECDYNVGAHPALLARLAETNLIPAVGYGFDEFSDSAKAKIRAACADPAADVWFAVGGTQVNLLAISSMLRPFEGVVSAVTGHINGHEAGAIEYTGHKVLTLPHHDGKLRADELTAYLESFFADKEGAPHMVQPSMVYITHPTEYGTLYTKKELAEIRAVCGRFSLPLYLDGARLGYALACPSSDVTLPDLAALTDAFTIGGTKCGALIGEALVFPRGKSPAAFFTQMKQRGAVLAKGRAVGVQFDALFTDGLYERIAAGAIEKAEKLRAVFLRLGYRLHIDAPTNQIFVLVSNERMEALAQSVRFTWWEKADEGHSVIRFVTSWATTDEIADALISLLESHGQAV